MSVAPVSGGARWSLSGPGFAARQRVELRTSELPRVGADDVDGDNRILDEPLALFFGFAPAVRPGGMASGAVFREQFCPLRRLIVIDLAEDFLGPRRRRKPSQQVFADDLALEVDRGVEQPFRWRLRCQVHPGKHAHDLTQVSKQVVKQHTAPLRPGRLRDVPDKRRLDGRERRPPVFRNAEPPGLHLIVNQVERVHAPRSDDGRGHRKHAVIAVNRRRVFFQTLAERLPAGAIALTRSFRQSGELCRIAYRCRQGVVQPLDKGVEIYSAVRAARDADPGSVVLELSVMACSTAQSDPFTLPRASAMTVLVTPMGRPSGLYCGSAG